MNDNTCVCCGAVIPEGRQVCIDCETASNVGYMRLKGKTIADRIKKMNLSELVTFFCIVRLEQPYCKWRIAQKASPLPLPFCLKSDCSNCIREWLESECKS